MIFLTIRDSICALEHFFCCSKGTRVSDYWDDNSVATTYFLLCHDSQLTPLLTCYTSESHQNSMLTDKCTYHSSNLPISFGLKACLDKNTTWLKPICLAFANVTPRTILCVKMPWLLCSYFQEGKYYEGEWCFGWGIFHLHILYWLVLIEIRFMAPVWTLEFPSSRAATAGLLFCC